MCLKEMAEFCVHSVVHDQHEQAWVIPMIMSWANSKIPWITLSPVSFHHGSRGEEVPEGKEAP